MLENLGFTPDETRHNGNELWYKSPFREEKTPSFKIDLRKNLWYDFGESVGGTVIDLVMKMRVTDAKGALAVLESKFGGMKIQSKDYQTQNLFPPKQAPRDSQKLVIKEVKDFPSSHSGNALVNYITQKRGIDSAVASKYLKEIHYKNTETGKLYFAAGLENREGGYEIRNPYFKSAIPEQSKSFSLIQSHSNSTQLFCFEGFLDFLSFITLEGAQDKADYLILNSVSMVKEAVKLAQTKGYADILTYFDNDIAGEKATQFFKEQCPQTCPQSHIFLPHKDLNDYLMRIHQQKAK
ncbi:MAG: toprim domain-containing protein [Saprospiraceae bacterium]|nr:toprim domain-containing protein [Saprospiraceae bacterium]